MMIDVVSDVVCPWCYVGKRHLEAAMRQNPNLEYTVHFRPFQLDPNIPREGLDRTDYMVRKFGSLERINEAHKRLEEMGSNVGIHFSFGKIKRAVNTLDAHRLIRWAFAAGTQSAVKESLLSLYFEQGVDISNRDVLIEVAGQNGLDTDVARTLLESGTDIDSVQQEIEQIQQIGISGVPFFILAGKYGLSGAQPIDVMARALEKAAEEEQAAQS